MKVCVSHEIAMYGNLTWRIYMHNRKGNFLSPKSQHKFKVLTKGEVSIWPIQAFTNWSRSMVISFLSISHDSFSCYIGWLDCPMAKRCMMLTPSHSCPMSLHFRYNVSPTYFHQFFLIKKIFKTFISNC
jgi:hypothetical protein